MKNRIWMGAAIGLLLAAGTSQANNLKVTNVTVVARNDSTAYVKFDIAWDNSWRFADINHDAAWVFFKVLPEGATDWQHVTLEGTGTNPTDYSIGSGTPIELIVPTERVGLFVRRSGEGAGSTAAQNVKAVWNFASNNLVKTGKVTLQAFAVEMVYVAEGAFYAGSGGSGVNEFTKTLINTVDPTVAPTGDPLAGGYPSGGVAFPAAAPSTIYWPNGYAAFYCMKHEVTEGQWVDFFNSLTDAQKTTRDITSSSGKNTDAVLNRNTVAWTTGDATTAARDRACSYVSWADQCAFADWAGLRPMTELEFEKACRGPLDPVANEYAWGNTTISHTTAIVNNDGTGTDTATGGNCNYNSCTPDGPYRVGIYATNGASRVSAGASHWGIMELSGNLYERTVTIGHATGRAFTGLHGNGALTTAGESDVSAWPPGGNGDGERGGAHYHGTAEARVSDRTYAAPNNVYSRHNGRGSRVVRTAP
ncbi:MAG: SUMF1/EgtB/PvdO family nonheme iron enzyme [Kiritimatiellia bacterium]